MDRHNKRNPVVLLRENTAEMQIPGMTMDQVGVDVGGVEIGATADRAKDRA